MVEKLRLILKQSLLARFLVVGGISFVVNEAALFVLRDHIFESVPRGYLPVIGEFDLALFLSSIIAVEISIVVRFVLNDVWTFRDRRDKPLLQRFWQSNFTSFGSPLISVACTNVLTPVLGISYLISNAIGIVLGLAWNWVWSVRVIWAPTHANAPSEKTPIAEE